MARASSSRPNEGDAEAKLSVEAALEHGQQAGLSEDILQDAEKQVKGVQQRTSVREALHAATQNPFLQDCREVRLQEPLRNAEIACLAADEMAPTGEVLEKESRGVEAKEELERLCAQGAMGAN